MIIWSIYCITKVSYILSDMLQNKLKAYVLALEIFDKLRDLLVHLWASDNYEKLVYDERFTFVLRTFCFVFIIYYRKRDNALFLF